MEDGDSGIFQSRTESSSLAESDSTGTSSSGSSPSTPELEAIEIDDISSLSENEGQSSSDLFYGDVSNIEQTLTKKKRLYVGANLPACLSELKREKQAEGVHELVPGRSIIYKAERDERWEFDDGRNNQGNHSSIASKEMERGLLSIAQSSKKVLKLQLPSSLNAENQERPDDAGASAMRMESFVERAFTDVGYKDSVNTEMHLELRDSNVILCSEWKRLFGNDPKVKISCQDIFQGNLSHDVIVIPGNSFGFLDGEPEIKYTSKLGWKLQNDVQNIISKEYDGELLVGQALKIPLHEYEIKDEATLKYVVYVPVMRVPLHVGDTVNAFLALRAALREVRRHNDHCRCWEKIRSILCPALCNGYGNMPSGRISLQMKTAYDIFLKRKRIDLLRPSDLGVMATHHVEMTSKIGTHSLAK